MMRDGGGRMGLFLGVLLLTILREEKNYQSVLWLSGERLSKGVGGVYI